MNINVSKSDDREAPTVFPVSVSNVTTTDHSELSITIHKQRSNSVLVQLYEYTSVSWIHLARPPFLPILEGPKPQSYRQTSDL
jgi:hypothetical protein